MSLETKAQRYAEDVYSDISQSIRASRIEPCLSLQEVARAITDGIREDLPYLIKALKELEENVSR